MIMDISSIIMKDFTMVNPCDGIQKIQNLVMKKNHYYFPVMEDSKLLGILTYKNLLNTHPNRIVADAMSTSVIVIPVNTSIWKAKDIFENKKDDILLVKNREKIIGFISKEFLHAELGKHTDLLTGLYKSDYIYYKVMELVNKEPQVSIIFIDINNFGKIDKLHGHIKGDSILKDMGKILKENSPKGTFICRFAGDEFVVVAPYLIDKASILANKLLNMVSLHPFLNNISVTISAGISVIKQSDIKKTNDFSVIYDFINAASLASTQAKKSNSHLAVSNIGGIA